jgi:hypothetical protein
MKINVWQYKPWWCQPWSIVLTGVAIIGGSWLLLHRVWVTALVTVPILTWMGYFLLAYPRLVNQMLTDAAIQAQESTEAE